MEVTTKTYAFSCNTFWSDVYVKEIKSLAKKHNLNITIDELYRGQRTKLFIVLKDADANAKFIMDNFMHTLWGGTE